MLRMDETVQTLPDTRAPVDFESFFQEHRTRLYGALWLVARDRHEAEEVAQDAFVRVWERWDRVGVMEDPAGYLYRTGLNLLRNRRRHAVLALRRVVHLVPSDESIREV